MGYYDHPQDRIVFRLKGGQQHAVQLMLGRVHPGTGCYHTVRVRQTIREPKVHEPKPEDVLYVHNAEAAFTPKTVRVLAVSSTLRKADTG